MVHDSREVVNIGFSCYNIVLQRILSEDISRKNWENKKKTYSNKQCTQNNTGNNLDIKTQYRIFLKTRPITCAILYYTSNDTDNRDGDKIVGSCQSQSLSSGSL